MNYDSEKLKKMILTLVLLAIGVVFLRFLLSRNSETLADYASKNPEKQIAETIASSENEDDTKLQETADQTTVAENGNTENDNTENSSTETDGTESISTETGATLNASVSDEDRMVYAEGFYIEPLSDKLKRYITGISYPTADSLSFVPVITLDELCYMHIMHYDFDAQPAEGELICNQKIANDLLEIFYELYTNEYQIEKVRLIDEYDGDDTASMLDNNTSCFNYRVVEGSTNLSKHAYGFALDINPFYNPYITYNTDGSTNISPEGSEAYADRNTAFPYKIDENDLCYKLFKQHGFTWGGNWNSCKDYQHFQKVVE